MLLKKALDILRSDHLKKEDSPAPISLTGGFLTHEKYLIKVSVYSQQHEDEDSYKRFFSLVERYGVSQDEQSRFQGHYLLREDNEGNKHLFKVVSKKDLDAGNYSRIVPENEVKLFRFLGADLPLRPLILKQTQVIEYDPQLTKMNLFLYVDTKADSLIGMADFQKSSSSV